MTILSKKDANKKQEELLKKEQLSHSNNLVKLNEKITNEINNCIKNKLSSVSISFPCHPDQDSGTKIFLISENRTSFDVVYDHSIVESLKQAGYNPEVSSKRDSYSGVLHYLIKFNLS